MKAHLIFKVGCVVVLAGTIVLEAQWITRHHHSLDWRAEVRACADSDQRNSPIHCAGHADAPGEATLTGQPRRALVEAGVFGRKYLALAASPADRSPARAVVTDRAGAVLTLLLFALIPLIGALMVGVSFRAIGPRGSVARQRLLVAAFALWGLVVVTRLALVATYVVDVPFMDQWDGEGEQLYMPWASGTLSLADVVRPHGAHRIVFTNVLNVAILELNGQWDPFIQTYAGACLAGAMALVTMFALYGVVGPGLLRELFFAVAFLFTSLFAWENAIYGFQTQFFFLIAFSVAGIWLTLAYRPPAMRWFIGAFALLSACLSMGSGVVAAATVAIVALPNGYRQLRGGRGWRSSPSLQTLGMSCSIVLLGWLTHASVPNLSAPTSLGDFALALGKTSAWPWIESPLLGVVSYVPLGCLALRYVVRGFHETRYGRVLLALGLWAFLQVVAIAAMRGVGGSAPSFRYMDLLALGMLANWAAGLKLTRCIRRDALRRCAMGLLLVGWVLPGIVGCLLLDQQVLRSWLPGSKSLGLAHAAVLKCYLASRDPVCWTKGPLAHPSVGELTLVLDSPVRRLLPPSLNPGGVLRPDTADGDAFVENGYYPTTPKPERAAIGSFGPRGDVSEGEFRSQLFPRPITPFIEIAVAGYLGRPGTKLVLRAADGTETNVLPADVPRENWTRLILKSPASDFVIVASDRSPKFWFAFTAPAPRGALGAELQNWLAYFSDLPALWAGGMLALLVVWRLVAAAGHRVA